MLYELSLVRARYGNRGGEPPALSIDSLSVDSGEIVAFVGPNGSGKTTLLKLLDGLLVPSEGRVLRDGAPVPPKAGRGAVRSPSGPSGSVYLHQYPYLLSGTVAWNVGLGCAFAGLDARGREARIRAALEELGLAGMARRRRRELSGGEAQRVALARALASGAGTLLLDEPSASADAASSSLVARALARAAAAGRTVLFSSHDPEFVRAAGARVVALDRGRLAPAKEIPHGRR